MTDTTALEEKIAHLTRLVEDLSDVVATQGREIGQLQARIGMLIAREAEREADSGSVTLADQKPPHW